MSRKVILVEELSKRYRLGLIGMGTLRHDLNRIWARLRGKPDPYAKIGEVNDRAVKGDSDFVWALKNINFSVEEGEILGIIGKNGAGKSTLLKILSKITQPTDGLVKMRGRIASLLEVGTGFHPELTGRENIYLNGTILGMTKNEVSRKLDEIVDFAGVAKYIDTPVKRYSSGMIVRLGFAVAAHLEPEILIVDEVLAVGDAAFQKRAIGKMKDVTSQEGRTVLFVSHNMQSIKSLCERALLLHNGELAFDGEANETVDRYLTQAFRPQFRVSWERPESAPGNERIRLKEAMMRFDDSRLLDVTTPFDIEIEFWNQTEVKQLNLCLILWSMKGECIFNVTSEAKSLSKGLAHSICSIPGNFLNDGEYSIEILFVEDTSRVIYQHQELLSFKVEDGGRTGFWHGKWIGAVRPKLDFTLNQSMALNGLLYSMKDPRYEAGEEKLD